MGSLHVQRCTRIGAMNHEGKTSNIEHRTSNSEKVPLPPETLRAFEVRGSRFEVHGKAPRGVWTFYPHLPGLGRKPSSPPLSAALSGPAASPREQGIS